MKGRLVYIYAFICLLSYSPEHRFYNILKLNVRSAWTKICYLAFWPS